MSLKEKLDSLAQFLDRQPQVEESPDLQTAGTKLHKALDDFLARARLYVYRYTAEYVELDALMKLPENKKTVTLAWINGHAAAVGRQYAKSGKKEKEDFLIAMVASGRAAEAIRELKESPAEKLRQAFNALLDLSEADAADRVRAMKPKELDQFCNVNSIDTGRTKKGGVDKKQTLANVLRKVEEAREYLKL